MENHDMIKKTIVSIACCALITPLAFAKETKQKKRTLGFVEQGVTVTGTTITTIEGGTAANYQPAKTLVIYQSDPKRDPNRYVLEGRGHVLNTKGEVIRTAVRPGAHVRVVYAKTGGVKTIDHVVVD
jgi:hypothetical protein